MESWMSEKRGYSITTRRLRLRCGHPQWLRLTQNFYNEIEMFYYDLLLEQKDLVERNSREILRELERQSLPGREKRTPQFPLPWERVPPCFRRAAANAGIAAAKSNVVRKCTGSHHSAVVYYKGMYRDFSREEITLKVWDGQTWRWMHCRLYGKDFPEDGQILSPSVVFEQEFLMLHVPVKSLNTDAASVKTRMGDGRNVCGLQFTNTDAFAVGSVADKEGKELALRFFDGGKEYSHYCGMVLDRLEKSRRFLGDRNEGRPNQRHWLHLKNLSEHYAHKISREIVDFCQEQNASVIAVPRFDREYSRYVMTGSGDWSPIHLSTRIRKYLQYKAWMAGIILIEVNAGGIGSTCSICNGEIVETDKKTGRILCANGHHGNRYLNAARNLSRKCREQFRE